MKKVFLSLGIVALLGAVSCSVDTSGIDKLNEELDKASKELKEETKKMEEEATK